VDNEGGNPYGYTGEWWEDDVGLLHLRARWYMPETGMFLSRDAVESEPPYLYARGNPINAIDSTGLTPDPKNPWDPEWCNNWWYPKKVSCDLITDPRTPYYVRLAEIYANYTMVATAQKAYGFHIGSKILRSYLNPSVSEVTFEGPGWKLREWIRNQPSDRLMEWHDKQVKDFYEQAILPAVEDCDTGPIQWKAKGGGPETPNPTASKLSRTEGIYGVIPIFNIFNERGFGLGKFYLKGDFVAENIQQQGNSVTADVTIKRFIDDEFRFDDDDFGGIPFHKKFSSWPNPGFGDMPHVWFHELQRNHMVSNVKVHMKWVEKFHYYFKPSK
jgi:RHS repeat-associated protein